MTFCDLGGFLEPFGASWRPLGAYWRLLGGCLEAAVLVFNSRNAKHEQDPRLFGTALKQPQIDESLEFAQNAKHH